MAFHYIKLLITTSQYDSSLNQHTSQSHRCRWLLLFVISNHWCCFWLALDSLACFCFDIFIKDGVLTCFEQIPVTLIVFCSIQCSMDDLDGNAFLTVTLFECLKHVCLKFLGGPWYSRTYVSKISQNFCGPRIFQGSEFNSSSGGSKIRGEG